MILRRITEHVKAQNWFAVGLDFLIVVIGVFVGLQVSNWNDTQNERQLKGYYLERLQSDLNETIRSLEQRQNTSINMLEIIDEFIDMLNNTDTEDSDLMQSTTQYFSIGTTLSDFKVTRTTFDDLSATGNLEVLGNSALTAAIVQLNLDYALHHEALLLNSDWIMPIDSETVFEFDWLRYDPITVHLFPPKLLAEQAADVRAIEGKLRRHAALHYWYTDRVQQDYAVAIEQTQTVLDMVELDLGKRP